MAEQERRMLQRLRDQLAALGSEEPNESNELTEQFLQLQLDSLSRRQSSVRYYGWLEGRAVKTVEDGRFALVTEHRLTSLRHETAALRRVLGTPVEEEEEKVDSLRMRDPPDHTGDPPWTGPLKLA